jgi:hypothetical protein
VCGTESEQIVTRSTNSIGSPDLDSRPPEMARSTIRTWVQRCPSCGYCAASLDDDSPHVREAMARPEYDAQLRRQGFTKLANSFCCESLIAAEAGDLARATWSLVHAAWACDDLGRAEAAAECRRRAAEMLQRAESAGQQVADQPGEAAAILVDLLRRAHQMESAAAVLSARRQEASDKVIRRVLEYHSRLIARRDTSEHAIDEALAEIAE